MSQHETHATSADPYVAVRRVADHPFRGAGRRSASSPRRHLACEPSAYTDYHEDPTVDDIGEPKLTGPLDVIVKIGGAGVCRTDLHILEGQWAEVQNPDLPYVIGHENAGWVHEVGEGVTNVAVGDTVILHPQPSCGLCLACRAGKDMQCENAFFPGLSNNDGGMAEYLRTTARACVKLDPSTNPADVAALADAGITAYHAVRKALPLLHPGHDRRGAGRRRARATSASSAWRR